MLGLVLEQQSSFTSYKCEVLSKESYGDCLVVCGFFSSVKTIMVEMYCHQINEMHKNFQYHQLTLTNAFHDNVKPLVAQSALHRLTNTTITPPLFQTPGHNRYKRMQA